MKFNTAIAALILSTLLPGLGFSADAPDPIELERAEARKWVPSDSTPHMTYAFKDSRIVRYQYRLEFFKGNSKKPVRVMRFKHSLLVEPHSSSWDGGNILVQTNPESGYCATNDEEKRKILLLGGRYDCTPWINKAAEYENFCGIVSPAGEIVFQFPEEKRPERWYSLVGIAAQGKRAAILVGPEGKIDQPADDAESDRGPIFDDIWIWEYPDKLRKRKLKPEEKASGANLRPLLNEGKL